MEEVGLEIDTPAALESLLAGQPTSLSGVVFQGLNLEPYSRSLRAASLRGCVFLGCRVDTELAGHLTREGCLYYPPVVNKPYNPFRTGLYTVEELYDTFDWEATDLNASYRSTTDFKIYSSYRDPDDHSGRLRQVLVDETLARRIHDNSISDALDEFLGNFAHRSVVAVMGGHAVGRDQPLFGEIARLTRSLRRSGYLPASGGGPGLMEATNLGAYLAPYPDETLEEVLHMLAAAPTFHSGGTWLAQACRVRQLYPLKAGGESLGIPTWFYGHEPANPFASHIAKYFENSWREEGLLALAQGGILFAPGGAGTVQEIFQDACQNYYTTYSIKSPMVFYPKAYWDGPEAVFPVYPVMQKLAQKGGFTHLLSITDDLQEIEKAISGGLSNS
ncbi:LOG family protein [bacterium]|nr:LOG family protein [bacterium]